MCTPRQVFVGSTFCSFFRIHPRALGTRLAFAYLSRQPTSPRGCSSSSCAVPGYSTRSSATSTFVLQSSNYIFDISSATPDHFKAQSGNVSKEATLLNRNAAVREALSPKPVQFKGNKRQAALVERLAWCCLESTQQNSNGDVHTPPGSQKQPFIGLYSMAAERDPYSGHISTNTRASSTFHQF